MGILLTVAVTHPENVPTIDLQYEVIDHYFASDRMSGKQLTYIRMTVRASKVHFENMTFYGVYQIFTHQTVFYGIRVKMVRPLKHH